MGEQEWPATPGSDEALAQGCICPVLDNAHGQGYMGPGSGLWAIVIGCPMHHPNVPEAEKP